jgi:beta-1,4-N-acetylglucosaminyltransferase
MSGENKKIALVCSHGGHLAEMEALWPAFSEHECFLVTHRCEQTEKLGLVQRTYLLQKFRPISARQHAGKPNLVHRLRILQNIGIDAWRMAKAFGWAVLILWRERPDVVLSTGSEIAIPFLWLGKLMGARTAYLETWCRVRTRSGTGPLVYPVTDLFLVQWPALLDLYGSKARYEGGIV